MKCLVIGASGYVGAKLYDDLKKKQDVVGTFNITQLFPELIQLDITDRKAVTQLVERINPSVIIHVAANASVSWCRENKEQAIALNEQGTRNIVDAANSVSSKVIYISSFAAIDPSTLYGETKSSGEELVKDTNEGYIILRPSIIMGLSPNITNDRPFNRVLKNILDKTPAVYDNSEKYQPTYLRHISEVVQAVINKNITNDIIPVSVPEQKTRFDMAKDILQHFDIPVKPISTIATDSTLIVEQDKLVQYTLPQYNYPNMLENIISELTDHLTTKSI